MEGEREGGREGEREGGREHTRLYAYTFLVGDFWNSISWRWLMKTKWIENPYHVTDGNLYSAVKSNFDHSSDLSHCL